MIPRLLASSLLAALALAAAADDAGPRALRWRELDVDARLDARGALHVVERHAMIFTGDWNGGERAFRVARGQRVRLERVARVDGGVERPLERGDLDDVDRWDWRSGRDGRVLRWRSRDPGDPPFRETELRYVIAYVLEGVVVPVGDGTFRLAHDFAFPDRPGPIEEVRARLALDPAWDAGTAPLTVARRDLPPGAGAVLAIPLRWTGAAPPALAGPVVAAPFPAALRLPLALAMLAGLGVAAAWVRRHDRARGLLAPEPQERIDDAWLRRHLLAHPPEVIGAAWDDHVGAPEVSAVLARMVADGRLATRLEPGVLGLGRTLHLALRVDRATLAGRERALVDGLFFDGDETDSKRLAKHYEKKGFDPSARLTGAKEAARRLVPRDPPRQLAPSLVAVALIGAAVILGGIGLARGEDRDRTAALALASALVLVTTGISAALRASAVTQLRARSVGIALALLVWAGLVVFASGAANAWTVLASVTLWTGGVLLVASLARTALAPGGIAARRRLAAARRHLARELRAPAPRLEDAWIPWILALGLGHGMDRWVRVHGASASHAGSAPGTSGGGAHGGSTWSGGGGAFSGAGASGTWAALGGLAAGVHAGSSGSGSGGGGASSGGGGGGGW